MTHTFALPSRDLQELVTLPPVNVDLLTEQCLGNLPFAITLLEEFAKTSQSRIEAMETHLANGDFISLADLIHGLSGVVGILGANILWELTTTLQSAAEEQNATISSSLLPILRAEMNRLCDYIPTVRALAKRN